jgi:hypothetical protein
MFNQSKWNQEDINHFNRSIISNEIKAVKNSLPTKKNPGTNGFMAEFYHTFKGLKSILLKNFQEIKGKEHYQTNSMMSLLYLFQNPTRMQLRKKRITGQYL